MESPDRRRRRLRRPAPDQDLETKLREIGGNPLADLTVAENGDSNVSCVTLAETLPNPVALLIQIAGKTPLMSDHMPRDEARHHLCLRRIHDANDVDAGPQAGTGHDVVDACADRANGLQIGIMFEGVVRRMPRDREANIGVSPVAAVIDNFDAVGDTPDFRTEVAAQIECAADESATHVQAALEDDIWPGTAARSSRV